jgi:TonB family protein
MSRTRDVLVICALALFTTPRCVEAANPVLLDAKQAKEIVLYAPKPHYPLRARRDYKTGAGVFIINVDAEKGVVESIKIEQTTGVWSLDVACLKALVQWRFKPHTVSKVRVPVRFVITPFHMG